MNKNTLNPKAVIMMVISTVVAFIIALQLKIHLFATSSWASLMFWLIFIGLASLGAYVSGRYINKGGKDKW